MRKRLSLVSIGGVFLFFPALAGGDEIIRSDGSTIPKVTIKSATLDEVSYTQRRITTPQRLSGDQVHEIVYESVQLLRTAEALLVQGNWAEAAAQFDRVARTGDPGPAEAGAFGKAKTAAVKFLETGSGGEEAAKALDDYLTAYQPKKGFYVPRALYLAGRAAVAAGDYSRASSKFDALAALPGTSRKLLADLGKGELALAKGEASSASTTFNTVLTRAKSGNLPFIYRRAAAFRGKALVAEKRFSDAISFLERFLETPKGKEVVFDRAAARAYNALGDAYAGKGGTDNEWEALYRYLWTTVDFRKWRLECAEAFYKAALLAEKLGAKNDAARLKEQLLGEYSDTVWAQKVKK